MSEDEGEVPVLAIVIGVMLVIGFFGWGFLAVSYVGAHSVPFYEPGYEESPIPEPRLRFFYTAFQQLPHFSAIVKWNFQNRIWLPSLILGLEAVAVVGGCVLKKIEKANSRPYTPRYMR